MLYFAFSCIVCVKGCKGIFHTNTNFFTCCSHFSLCIHFHVVNAAEKKTTKREKSDYSDVVYDKMRCEMVGGFLI